jgi:hypothetical protein
METLSQDAAMYEVTLEDLYLGEHLELLVFMNYIMHTSKTKIRMCMEFLFLVAMYNVQSRKRKIRQV